MKILLRIRNALGSFYGAGEFYIRAVSKFILTFLCLYGLVHAYDYLPYPGMTAAALFLSLVSMAFPWGFSLLTVAVLAVADLFFFHPAAGAAGAVLAFITACLYLGFLKGRAQVVLLSGLGSALGLGAPVWIGVMLFRKRGDAARVLLGTFAGIALRLLFLFQGETFSLDTLLQQILSAFGIVLQSPGLWGMVLAAGLTCLTVFLTVCIPLPYSLPMAACAGTVVMMLTEGMLWLAPGIGSGASIAVSTVLAAVLCIPLSLLLMVPVEGPAEYLQFEDDDYLYYVKAVPKLRASQEFSDISAGTAEKKNL